MKEIIADQLNVEADEITEATSFKDDLGADSLDLFELVMALEEEYNVGDPLRGSGKSHNGGRRYGLSERERCRSVNYEEYEDEGLQSFWEFEYPIIQGGMAWVAEA